MVDALVLEASTSVCGFESHLPHQKKRAPKGVFFFWCLLRRGLPLRSICGRNLRFPHTRPSLFVIPYSLRSKLTAPATGRGLEPNCAPGFFFAPNQRPRSSRSEPSRIKEGTREGAFFCFVPPASPRQPFPNPCRRAALRNYSLFPILSSLSQPCSFFPPERTAKQKYILFFDHLTHNSERYNIGLNLIMEGKEYGKTGSA